MSTASFIASQRTDHGVPCALACRALGVPASTFYARINAAPSPTRRRPGRGRRRGGRELRGLRRDLRVAEGAG